MGQRDGVWLCVVGVMLGGCAPAAPGPDEGFAAVESELSRDERRERIEVIRRVLADEGLDNALLWAGLAYAETGMAHCWSEARWACRGPASTSCDGGPVIAGSADGACWRRQGGLGMFQFDAGDYDDTLRREGRAVLELEGNIRAAAEFVIRMVIRSRYISGVSSREQAIRWINGAWPGTRDFSRWIETVTHYYNGCGPGCRIRSQRMAHYRNHALLLWRELGEDYWQSPVATCDPIPEEGRVLDDADTCFTPHGPSRWWRSVSDAGWGGGLLWTNATDASDKTNYADWQLHFDTAGRYTIEVYTDGAYAESRQARYHLHNAGDHHDIVIDQTGADGWQTLGTFHFWAGGGQDIRVDDNTGEHNSLGRAIVVDALRVWPEGGSPPDAGDPAGDP